MRKNSKPIVALVLTRSISQREFDELTVSYFNDGTHYGRATEDSLDLFFADDEEELTEFEKAMIQFSHERNSLIQFEHTKEEINAHLYRYSKKLLNLARTNP